MKKVLSVITCSILAACSCNENQWEEVDAVTFEDVVYVEEAEANKAPVIVEPAPVYVQAPQPVNDCPCAEVAPMPCYQPVCYQPCACQPMPAPQPKITTTKKIITTTTTVEEPCGKPVCEPVVTVHEEVIPTEVTYSDYENSKKQAPQNPVVEVSTVTTSQKPVVQTPSNLDDYVEVTVEKNPYRSEVVDMRTPTNVAQGTTVKYSPEAYIVVATRATNRMLQDTSAIYDNGLSKIYIKDINLLSSDLPYGSHRLKGATRDIISGSKTFDVVNNIKDADFVIEPTADWFVASNNSTPALQYKMTLLDKNGKKLDEWIEIIRQVKE